MTTGETIALTRRTFVGKVMSLLFHRLSRLVISFLPRSKCLLISWLQLQSAVILESPKIKCFNVSIVCPSSCHEVMGLDATNLAFWMLSSNERWVEKQWGILESLWLPAGGTKQTALPFLSFSLYKCGPNAWIQGSHCAYVRKKVRWFSEVWALTLLSQRTSTRVQWLSSLMF